MVPDFIAFFSERIGKPVSEFDLDDWRRAAIGAAQLLDAPKIRPKPRGRPKVQATNRLADLLNPTLVLRLNKSKSRQPRGRPIAKYGRDKKYSIEFIEEVVSDVTSPEARKRWPNEAPFTRAEAVRLCLKVIGHPVGYAPAVQRALRRLKSGQK